jgi:tetratricopeptide (TPR) repeat protein
MNEMTHLIREILGRQLQHHEIESIDITPIPSNRDRIAKLRTLEEILNDFSNHSDQGTIGYFLKVKPKSKPAASTSSVISASQSSQQIHSDHKFISDGVYLNTGKLNVPYLLKNANLLMSAKDYGLAKNIFRAVAQTGESTSQALHGIGVCLEAEGKLEEAKAQFEESIAYQPSFAAYRKLIQILVRQTKFQQAAEISERALQLHSLEKNIRIELHTIAGTCWSKTNIMHKAEKHFLRASDLAPESEEIQVHLGNLYLQGGRNEDAKRRFADAFAANSKNFSAIMGLAATAVAEGDIRSAHDYYVQALNIELNNPTAIFYLVKYAYELKTYATAARLVEEYIQVAPVSISLLYSLAGLQFHLGRIGDSKKTAQKILSLQPQHQATQDLLKIIEKY